MDQNALSADILCAYFLCRSLSKSSVQLVEIVPFALCDGCDVKACSSLLYFGVVEVVIWGQRRQITEVVCRIHSLDAGVVGDHLIPLRNVRRGVFAYSSHTSGFFIWAAVLAETLEMNRALIVLSLNYWSKKRVCCVFELLLMFNII